MDPRLTVSASGALAGGSQFSEGALDSQSSQLGCAGWDVGPSGAVGAADETTSCWAEAEGYAAHMAMVPRPAEPLMFEG